MLKHTDYIPILKWRQGEYQALSRLTDGVKNRIIPILEICPVGYDFESKKERETVDSHISDLGSRLKMKWGQRLAFVDTNMMNITTNRAHYITEIFGKYRASSCRVIPVISIEERDLSVLKAFAEIVKQDGRGVAIRIKTNGIDQNSISDKIAKIYSAIGLRQSDIDIIVDFERVNILLNERVTFDTMQKFFSCIPDINMWRSFIVAGNSFPEAPSKETGLSKRLEWLFYKDCVEKFKNTFRIPSFSDYSTSNHEHVMLDMRIIKPSAKMKYTIDDGWYFQRGGAVRGPTSRGYAQFSTLCKNLKSNQQFRGAKFSEGDKYIVDCAAGKAKTGNLSTWVWVASNQHITKIVNDLSSLYGFSI